MKKKKLSPKSNKVIKNNSIKIIKLLGSSERTRNSLSHNF